MNQTAIVPSSYQQDILNWVLQGQGNAVVIARAGSGKTKTLEMIFSDISEYGIGRVTSLAFNKRAAEELGNRLGAEAGASTLNSKGHGIVAKYLKASNVQVRLDQWKYPNFFREYLAPLMESFGGDLREGVSMCVDLLGKAMSELSDGSDGSLQVVVEHYGCEMPYGMSRDQFFESIRAAMAYGERAAKQGFVAFDDQIWLPSLWNLGYLAYKTDWVLIDECQDLSLAKLELAMMCCDLDGGGRMIFVGDDRQAIYGFAGASADSVPNIIARTQAQVFHLPISYRCPVAVINAAKRIVPDIEARPDAPEGEVRTISEHNLSQELTPGSLVLCRLTSPLVSLCIKLLRDGVPAQVRGRDIGRALVKMAADAQGQAPWERFADMLSQYCKQKAESLSALHNSESRLAELYDRKEAILAIMEGSNVRSIVDFGERIDSMFSDAKATITLSTIHRAKGEEAMDVYIISPDKLPLIWPDQQAWEYAQEINLKYVAITRSKDRLTFVKSPAKVRPFLNEDAA